MRSKLFVPGSRPEFFAKALAGEADAISIDLEDAVAESRKDEARANVRAFLQSDAALSTKKVIIVRVNAIDTVHFERDIAAVTLPAVSMFNLPKPESAADIQHAAGAMERIDLQRAGGARPPHRPIGILANIETPKALRNAHEIGAAHPRVAGLQLGFGDLFEPLGIARRDVRNVHAAMFALRLAAGEAGVFAYDSAFADVQDAAGYREEAAMAQRLGYLGKSCIHPRQVLLANDVFQPADDEVEHARRVIAAFARAAAEGAGAILVDGKMIDRPFVRRAEMIVAVADRMQLNH